MFAPIIDMVKYMQDRVRIFCERNNVSISSTARFLDLVSETGELAKEVLNVTNYGEKEAVIKNENMILEFGDVIFVLFALANSLDIDADDALKKALEKYENRLLRNNSLSS